MITITEDRFASTTDGGFAASVTCLEKDISSLPTNVPNGTFCFVMDATDTPYYVFNAEDVEWVPVAV